MHFQHRKGTIFIKLIHCTTVHLVNTYGEPVRKGDYTNFLLYMLKIHINLWEVKVYVSFFCSHIVVHIRELNAIVIQLRGITRSGLMSHFLQKIIHVPSQECDSFDFETLIRDLPFWIIRRVQKYIVLLFGILSHFYVTI